MSIFGGKAILKSETEIFIRAFIIGRSAAYVQLFTTPLDIQTNDTFQAIPTPI